MRSAVGGVRDLFGLTAQVLGWRAEARPVWLARVVSVTGMGSSEPAAAVAFTGGQPAAGSILAGAADPALSDAFAAAADDGGAPRLLDLQIGDEQAVAVGLTCGGRARVLVQPAGDLPEPVWQLLGSRTPLCLVTDLDPARLGQTDWLTLGPGGGAGERDAQAREVVAFFGRGTTEAAVIDLEERSMLVTALWPAARLLVVGDGLIADALDAASRLLGWEPVVTDDADGATAAVGRLGPGDGVVVLSHDRAVDGPVLAAALSSEVGYLAALGSRRTQAARADWLAEHGVPAEALVRVRGPAGLDIGARTPAEVAVSIVAEMVAVRSGAGGSPLAEGAGPIHHDGLHAPPARHVT